MLNFSQYLNELFDNPVKFINSTRNNQFYYEAIFKIDSNIYTCQIEKRIENNTKYEITFYNNHDFRNITNAGDQYKVLSTVIDITRKYFNSSLEELHSGDIISFSFRGDKHSDTKSFSIKTDIRFKIYNRFANMISKEIKTSNRIKIVKNTQNQEFIFEIVIT